MTWIDRGCNDTIRGGLTISIAIIGTIYFLPLDLRVLRIRRRFLESTCADELR